MNSPDSSPVDPSNASKTNFAGAEPAGQAPAPSGDAAAIALLFAHHVVTGARATQYATPERNFKRIGKLRRAIETVQADCSPESQALIEDSGATEALRLIAVKIARILESPTHADSWADLAGYAGCGYRCVIEHLREQGRHEEADASLAKIKIPSKQPLRVESLGSQELPEPLKRFAAPAPSLTWAPVRPVTHASVTGVGASDELGSITVDGGGPVNLAPTRLKFVTNPCPAPGAPGNAVEVVRENSTDVVTVKGRPGYIPAQERDTSYATEISHPEAHSIRTDLCLDRDFVAAVSYLLLQPGGLAEIAELTDWLRTLQDRTSPLPLRAKIRPLLIEALERILRRASSPAQTRSFEPHDVPKVTPVPAASRSAKQVRVKKTVKKPAKAKRGRK